MRRIPCSWYVLRGAAAAVALVTLYLFMGRPLALPIDDPKIDRLLPLHPLVGTDRDRLVSCCDAELQRDRQLAHLLLPAQEVRAFTFLLRCCANSRTWDDMPTAVYSTTLGVLLKALVLPNNLKNLNDISRYDVVSALLEVARWKHHLLADDEALLSMLNGIASWGTEVAWDRNTPHVMGEPGRIAAVTYAVDCMNRSRYDLEVTSASLQLLHSLVSASEVQVVAPAVAQLMRTAHSKQRGSSAASTEIYVTDLSLMLGFMVGLSRRIGPCLDGGFDCTALRLT